ncbi:CPBP family intramembrane glutamic endopeptidase [Sorangium sp. So ce341]|uniref:CPBP family intramembrane glutamic endopeptidase n=1 Tax=Sorangium sp. So ce341 TaxID=3133302 RepID=UPI003F617BEA
MSHAAVAAASLGRFRPGSLVHLAHAAGIIVLMIGATTGLGLIASVLFGRDFSPFDGSPRAFALLGVQFSLMLVAGRLVLLHVGRVSLRDLGWRGLSAAQIGLGLAGFIPCLICITAVLASMGVSPGELHETIAAQPWSTRALCLCLGLVAAFTEESLFRGYLQPSLCARLGSTGGMLITALLFSLYHLPRALPMIVSRLVLGLVFGALRGRDRPLRAPAIAHALVWVILGAV